MSWRASRADELIQTALADRHSYEARMELLRRALLLADREGDQECAESVRQHIVNNHIETDADFDVVAAFAWLLHKGRSGWTLMWYYKWIVAVLSSIHTVPLRLVEAAIEDLEQRHRHTGLSDAPAHQLRLEVAMTARQLDRLPELFALWEQNEEGDGADCAACRRDKRVDYFAEIGDEQRMLVEAEPILQGKMRCHGVPRATYPTVILALLRAGEMAEARKIARRGVKALGEVERTNWGLGPYQIYFAATDQFERGGQLLSTWLRRILRTRSSYRRYQCYRGARILFRRAVQKRVGVIALSLPPGWSQFQPDGIYETERLANWFDQQAQQLADQFDARHENTGYRDELKADESWLTWES